MYIAYKLHALKFKNIFVFDLPISSSDSLVEYGSGKDTAKMFLLFSLQLLLTAKMTGFNNRVLGRNP